ncbi:MAG: mandelate racemase/muconate lactonizing protein [Rhodospirillaceae bacterium]|jgi:L-alanine-DL-glutamate epimerase-like enolase superfamily enzyme|nr:mandelate racemase/muconate lactonizing protein [Rhodospirillaceae bacterium]
MSDSPLIERIELTTFEIKVENMTADPSGFGISYAPGESGPQIRFALRIMTDTGVVGEYVPGRGRARVIKSAVEALGRTLLGKPALQRQRHYQSLRRLTKHIGEVGIGALDIALWDLAGKHHGAPVYELLGGHRTRLPAYASTIGGDRLPGGLSSADAYADFAEQCLEMGYKGYKMHGWSNGDVAEEAAMIAAVAKRVGGRMDIMYDSACHLQTLADAIQIGRVCDEHGLYWLEDPYADGGVSIHGHKMLKKAIRTPILISEHVRNLETTTDMMVAGATDFARIDPDYDGGITAGGKVAAAAEGLGMDVEVHSCGPAMRHLMAACRNSNYYEVNLVHPKCPNAWSLPIYEGGYSDQLDCIDSDGCVSVPDGPGLGMRYDWDAIKRTALETIVIE